MFFEYKNIKFDISDKIPKKEIMELFDKIISIAPPIQEVYIEGDDIDAFGEIFIDVKENTENFVKELDKLGLITSTSDEDYGDLKAINFYLF